LLCVALMGGALAIWARYNFVRFRNVDRRTPLPPVTNSQLAEFFKVNEAILSTQQEVQCLSVSFDDDGNIIRSTKILGKTS